MNALYPRTSILRKKKNLRAIRSLKDIKKHGIDSRSFLQFFLSEESEIYESLWRRWETDNRVEIQRNILSGEKSDPISDHSRKRESSEVSYAKARTTSTLSTRRSPNPYKPDKSTSLSCSMRMSSALTTGTPIPSSASRSTRESDTHIKVLPRVHDKVAARASAEDIAAERESSGKSSVRKIRKIKAEKCARRRTGRSIFARGNERDSRARPTASKMENAWIARLFFYYNINEKIGCAPLFNHRA